MRPNPHVQRALSALSQSHGVDGRAASGRTLSTLQRAMIAVAGTIVTSGCYVPDQSTLAIIPERYGFIGEEHYMQVSSHVTDGVEVDLHTDIQTSATDDGDWVGVTMDSTTPRVYVVAESYAREGEDRQAWHAGLFTGVQKATVDGGATVVNMGDSITANGSITARIQSHLAELGVTVHNHAVSGKTWQWYAADVEGIAETDAAIARAPDVVTWMLGTNGLFTAYPSASGLTGYPAYVAAEIDAAERLFARFPATTVHLVAPPPPGNDVESTYLVYEPYDEPHHPNAGISTRQRWLFRTHDVMTEYKAAWADRDDVVLVPARSSIHRTDGYGGDTVHPGVIGLNQLGDAFAPAILWAIQRQRGTP